MLAKSANLKLRSSIRLLLRRHLLYVAAKFIRHIANYGHRVEAAGVIIPRRAVAANTRVLPRSARRRKIIVFPAAAAPNARLRIGR